MARSGIYSEPRILPGVTTITSSPEQTLVRSAAWSSPHDADVSRDHDLEHGGDFTPTVSDVEPWRRGRARFESETRASSLSVRGGIRDSLELMQPCIRPKSPLPRTDLSIPDKIIKRMRRTCRAILKGYRERRQKRRESASRTSEAESEYRCAMHGSIEIETEEDRQAVDRMREFRWPDQTKPG